MAPNSEYWDKGSLLPASGSLIARKFSLLRRLGNSVAKKAEAFAILKPKMTNFPAWGSQAEVAPTESAIVGVALGAECPQLVVSGHTDKSAPCPLFPITDVGRRIQVSTWMSLYEYTPLRFHRNFSYRFPRS